MVNNVLYHCFSLLWHHVTAWNTGGEGIHSPRLFYLVRMVFRDSNRYYAWQSIERQRLAMLQSSQTIQVTDYGVGRTRSTLRRVNAIAQTGLSNRTAAELLFRLVMHMTGDEYRLQPHGPLNIIELGTSLGITTAYLAAADSRNRVVTFEGSDEIVALAKANWSHLGLQNIVLVQGNIDDTLYNYAREEIDFAFIDANHTGEATLRYFEIMASCIHPDGIVAIDDIRYSADMYAAWKQIIHHPKVTATMDLGNMGLVFFEPHLERKTYLLRI